MSGGLLMIIGAICIGIVAAGLTDFEQPKGAILAGCMGVLWAILIELVERAAS